MKPKVVELVEVLVRAVKGCKGMLRVNEVVPMKVEVQIS